jgi:hypothetical protein
MAVISIKLMDDVRSADEETAINGMAALLVLPGYLEEIRHQRARSVVVELREILDSGDFAAHILTRAKKIVSLRPSREPVMWSPPTLSGLEKRLDARLKEGRISAASSLLEEMHKVQEGISLEEPLSLNSIKQKMRALNPPARELDILPDLPENGDPEGLTFSRGEVDKAIRRLPPDTCTGSSGWSNRAIMAVALTSGKTAEFEGGLTRIFNQAFAGTLHKGVVALWVTCRAALIPKPDGSWRPLGMGECFYRLMGRVAIKSYSAEVGKELAPLQMCVGVSGGCEIAARMADLAMLLPEDNNERVCAMQLDISNAFNEMPRGKVAEAVLEYAPKLMRWFRLFYGETSDLRMFDGEIVGQSATGVRQGDPMAMLLYAVGFQAVLIRIRSLVTRLQAETESKIPTGVVSYADDTTVYAGTSVAEKAVIPIQEIVEEHGMRMNVQKGMVLLKEGDAAGFDSHGMPVTEEGMRVLGNAIGSDEYKKRYCETSLREMQAPLTALRLIHPQSALVILAHSINAKPGFLIRVMDRECSREAAEAFDAAVDNALTLEICQSAGGADVATLRSLPQSMGGLGMIRYAGKVGDEANRKSIALTRAFIEHCVPDLRIVIPDSWRGVEPTAMEEEDDNAEVLAALPESVQTSRAMHRDAWVEVYQHLVEDATQGHAAILISASQRGSGRWLFCTSQWDYAVKFTAAEFRAALCVRLLGDPIPLPGNHSCACQQHQRGLVRYAEMPFHPLSCTYNQLAWTRRHNIVRDQLFDLLKRVCPKDEVVKERWLDVVEGERIRCDIWCRMGGLVYIVDVSVVEPSSQMYLLQESWKVENVANKLRENVKCIKYQHCRALQQEGGASLVPFVLEATGRLGPAAVEFMSKLNEENTLYASLFLDHMAAGLARATGQMVNQARWNMERPFTV